MLWVIWSENVLACLLVIRSARLNVHFRSKRSCDLTQMCSLLKCCMMKDDASQVKFRACVLAVFFCTLYICKLKNILCKWDFRHLEYKLTHGCAAFPHPHVFSQQPLWSVSVCTHNLGDLFLETVAEAIKQLSRVKMTPISPAYTCFLQIEKKSGESCCCLWEYVWGLYVWSFIVPAQYLLQFCSRSFWTGLLQFYMFLHSSLCLHVMHNMSTL